MTVNSADSVVRARSKWNVLSSVLGPFLALSVVILFFGVADWRKPGNDTFLTQQNFRTITVSTATVAVAALGMTVVIIAGGIDLSAGSAIALCATVLAWGLKEDVGKFAHGSSIEQVARQLADEEKQLAAAAKLFNGNLDAPELSEQRNVIVLTRAKLERCRNWTAPLAVLMAVAAGCACGLLNGLLVSYLRVVPFIVTLGTMMIYLGAAKQLASETTVRPAIAALPDWLQNFTSLLQKALWFGLPTGVWLTFWMALALAAVLRFSVFGRYVFALGSNESTARLCGINVTQIKIAVYVVAGLFVGLAGVYQFSRLSVGNPSSGTGLELKIIAAVVIGGASLSGGRGSILGTLSGAAIMAVITSGCTLLELKNPIQDVILGVIIIAAVCVDQIRQRRLVS